MAKTHASTSKLGAAVLFVCIYATLRQFWMILGGVAYTYNGAYPFIKKKLFGLLNRDF